MTHSHDPLHNVTIPTLEGIQRKQPSPRGHTQSKGGSQSSRNITQILLYFRSFTNKKHKIKLSELKIGYKISSSKITMKIMHSVKEQLLNRSGLNLPYT